VEFYAGRRQKAEVGRSQKSESRILFRVINYSQVTCSYSVEVILTTEFYFAPSALLNNIGAQHEEPIPRISL